MRSTRSSPTARAISPHSPTSSAASRTSISTSARRRPRSSSGSSPRKGICPQAQAKLVVEIAKAQSVLFGGVEDFQVTREFSNRATHEEKLALLHCLFAVSSADETIAVVEDNEIRRISRELRIEHADYIAARLAHRQHLGVLKAGRAVGLSPQRPITPSGFTHNLQSKQRTLYSKVS